MKIARVLFAMLALATVSACATPFQVSDVQDTLAAPSPTAGTPFTKALFEEYRTQAKQEALAEYAWDHAAIFAAKADRAATGEVVLPENPAEWDLPAPVLPELTQARATLMDDFDKGARERIPAEAAKAQVSLDCWIEEEWERDTDSSCKTAFLATEPKLKPPAPAPKATEAPLIPQPLVVLFDTNKAEITGSAMQNLYDVAETLKTAKLNTVRVYGFTDTVGAKSHNQKLSDRRAKAVVEQLKKLGVTAQMVDVKGFGKDKLAVPTKDNISEHRNRRVEVTWEPPTASAR
ncbi:Outer membrane protein [Candidatus Terasakiella magnetica]|nr:Outer membrane protein [Candidatus Terasakiella magnetica]